MEIGQKVIGFSWTPSEYPDLYYNQSSMDKHIGKVGVIVSVLSMQYRVKFTSENGEEASWEYPLALKERGIIKPVVGEQAQGFRFKSMEDGLSFNGEMENYIGKVGVIKEIREDYGRYRIDFEDGEWWWYPLNQAWKGLIQEVNTNTNTNNQLNVSTMRTKGFFIKPNFGGGAPSGMTAVKWTAYINFINKVSKSTFTGNSYSDDSCYGIAMDGDGEATSDPERFGAGNVELNLNDWFKQFVSENLPSSGFYIKNDYCNDASQSIAEMDAFIHGRSISNNGKWRVYIEFLNTIYVEHCGGTFSGDAREDYYGITPEGLFNNFCRESFFKDSKNLTLDGFWDMITGVNIIRPTAPEPIVEEEEVDVEMITDYAGNEQRLCDCVQLDEYAPNYGGEWALQDEVTYCEYNGGSCLSEDAVMEQGGDYFFAGTECDYDIEYSDYDDEWLDTNRDGVYYGYVHGCEHETWFHMGGWSAPFEVNDSYFRDTDALEYHGYVEYDDEWMTEDQYNDMVRRSNNATYHSNERHRNGFIGTRPMRFGSDAKFTIGFEIEKEDDDAVEIGFYDLYNRTGWVKEDDGSLDGTTGYELVSPAFDLYESLIDQEIENDEDLQTLINADQSGACGGHINLGSTVHTTEELFELLSGYFPLFYSIYEHRIDKTYSKAKKKHQYYDRDKYSAIFIKPNVLEFRIPSAVKNVNNLLWRRDLLRIMCSSIKSEKIKALNGVHYKPVTEAEVLKMLVNPSSKLYKHMRKVFSYEAMIRKVESFIQYSGSFNNTYLPRIIRSEFPTDNINNNVEHDQDGMGA